MLASVRNYSFDMSERSDCLDVLPVRRVVVVPVDFPNLHVIPVVRRPKLPARQMRVELTGEDEDPVLWELVGAIRGAIGRNWEGVLA